MTNYEFLRIYYGLQSGIMFDRIDERNYGLMSFCKTSSSPFWNNVLVGEMLSDNEIDAWEAELRVAQRKSAFYFENCDSLKVFERHLISKGYKKEAEDSLMFFAPDKPDLTEVVAKEVETEEELEEFLRRFDMCYQKDDSQNPYGELGEYLESARLSWIRMKGTGRLNYYIFYDEDIPVAVSALTNYMGVGYVSNVGSLREVRGRGFGKAATLYAIKKSMENGNSIHSIATEEGTYPNEFYKRIGFETKFTALLYVAER